MTINDSTIFSHQSEGKVEDKNKISVFSLAQPPYCANYENISDIFKQERINSRTISNLHLPFCFSYLALTAEGLKDLNLP